MSEIKKLLHRYLCEDAIKVCELAEKADDFVWCKCQYINAHFLSNKYAHFL